MRFSNFHTHSCFSDGKNTPEEMVCSAIERGFTALGFSDHSETKCDLSYCMKLADYPAYFKTINDLKEKYKKAITATDEMLKAKFREMFGGDGDTSRGAAKERSKWPMVSLAMTCLPKR